jgi:cell division transport system permease protein
VIHPALSALRRSARLAARRPRAALWTVLALASALFVAGLAALAAATLDRYAEAHPGTSGHMVVYLGEGVDEARASALVFELGALHGVERAELVSAAESARRLTRALGADPALLDGVDLASLPASVEVTLAPGVRDVVAMSPTVRALRGAPGVVDVVVDRAPAGSAALMADSAAGAEGDRSVGALPAARAIAWTGAALVAGLALIIMLATVRLRLERSAQEAAVLRLLGARPGFVAIPSALAGALQGVVAAVVAALALGLVLHDHGPAGGALALASPPDGALAGLIALGGLVGLVGGGLAGVARAR